MRDISYDISNWFWILEIIKPNVQCISHCNIFRYELKSKIGNYYVINDSWSQEILNRIQYKHKECNRMQRIDLELIISTILIIHLSPNYLYCLHDF